MITSSANQYLRPEYLSPLPTTLDAKKSPLALLAQTCSQIGADTPNTKLLASAEKSSKSSKSDSIREKTSPASSNNSASDLSIKSSFKPYDLNSRDKSRSPEERTGSVSSRVRTPISSKSNPNTPITNGRCASNQSASSPRASPATLGRKTPSSNPAQNVDLTSNTQENKTINEIPVPASGSLTSPSSKSSFTPSTLTSPSDSLKDFSSYKASVGLPVTSSAYLGYPTPGLPHPMDLMASNLIAQHHHALKSGALNPYLEYARLKNATSNGLMAPVCRDPYCTGCSLSSHLLATSTASGKTPGSNCPAGCTQCDHVGKTPSYLSHNPAAAAYAHAQLAALAAASQLPYVCNWIAGDANYCGKRFSSSEELLQHLRTHTSLGSLQESSAAALSMLSPPNLPPTHPLLHRTYPTPPLSPLATARYHPYSKPSLLPPSLTPSSLSGFSLPPHPGLPPYFSPYSLYGPRLGAASGMHP